MKKNGFLFALFLCFVAKNAFSLPRLMPIENESDSDGAGAIVFDTSKLPLENNGEKSIFSFGINDSHIDFSASGYWKSEFSSEATFFGGFGNDFEADFSVPVFSQEVDLSLFLKIDKKWYFEADFADEFSRNTLALGYDGDGIVKSVRVANRGIRFSGDYSTDFLSLGIGGGENEAPGIAASFSGEKWRADAVFRYDFLEPFEKEWFGKNAVTKTEYSLFDWDFGSWFVLPDKMAENVVAVFVESRDGSEKDAAGRTYRALSSAEYLLVPSLNSVLLSADAKSGKNGGKLPRVAFLIDGADEVALKEFWEETKAFFKESDDALNIEQFCFFGDDVKNAFSTIDSKSVLIVQSPAGFSPFASAHRYDLGSLSKVQEAVIASKSTHVSAKEYDVSVKDDDFSFVQSDFFREDHLYVSISISGEKNEPQNPAFRFPLAKTNPLCYLGVENKNGSLENDYILLTRAFSAVSRFDIGTNAILGTIRVYKNGILDAAAVYDEESGEVTPSVSIGQTDFLKITWYEEGSEDAGSFASEIGFAYDFGEHWSADISASGRYTTGTAALSVDEKNASPAYAALALGTHYQNGSFSFRAAQSAAIETDDTTGLCRILSMNENANETHYHQKNALSSIPQGFVPLLNCKNAPTLFQSDFVETETENGILDDEISGYALPISWDFSTSVSQTNWSAKTISLSLSNSALSNASVFEFSVKDVSDDFQERIFLQLGVDVSDDSDFFEEKSRVATWEITDDVLKNPNFKEGTISVVLSDSDRAKIASAGGTGMRVIVTGESGSGTVLFGPYKAHGSNWAVSADEETLISVTQEEESINSKTVKKLNEKNNEKQNYVQIFSVKLLDGATNSKIKATHYFEKTSAAGYESIVFFAKIGTDKRRAPDSILEEENEEPLIFTIDDATGENIAAKIAMNKNAVKKLSDDEWHEITIETQSRSVKIDGEKTDCAVFVQSDAVFSRFKIEWNPLNDDGSYFTTLSLDELHLSDSKGRFSTRSKAHTAWKMQNENAILSDFEASADANAYTSRGFENADFSKSADFSSSLKASVLLFRTEAALAANLQGLLSASHSVKTQKALLGFLSASEQFSFIPGESASKSNSFGIEHKNSAFFFKTTAKDDGWSRVQESSAEAKTKVAGANFLILTNASQTLGEKAREENWAKGFFRESALAFSTGDEEAKKRQVSYKGEISRAFHVSFLKIEPEISILASGSQKKDSADTESDFSDSESVKIVLPFSFSKKSFSFSYKKSAGGTKKEAMSGGYGKDSGRLFEKISERPYFLKAFLIQDLVSDTISKEIFSSLDTEKSAFYSTSYEANFKRSGIATGFDFLIPKSTTISLTRDIRSAGSTSDMYQARLKTNNTAVNLFGKRGTHPLFSWYEQDEFSSSLSVSTKIPKESPSDWSWQISSYIQSTFVIFEGNELKAGLEGTLGGKDDWSAKVTAVWKRKGNSAFIDGAVFLFWKAGRKKKSDGGLIHTKTDSVNVSLSSSVSGTSVTKKYRADYTHKIESALTKYVSLNTAIGGSYNAVWEKSVSVGAIASIGVSVTF